MARSRSAHARRRTRAGAGLALFAAFSAVGALVLLGILEGALALLLRAPIGSGPSFFEEARRRYHVHHERGIVQYTPGCAEYDPRLGYRLAPGSCRFATRVFDTELRINASGTRDDESALSAPRIVVLGDSYAMGWGVGQGETVSAEITRLTGEKTLNAAISSYGTAREMMLLGRLDLSAAHTLVIQYCENDFDENVAFVRDRGRLQTMSRETYQATVREHLAATRYTPGKHLHRFAPLLWRGWRGWPEADPVRPCARDAEAFLAVLRLAEPPPRPLRVLVFEGLYGPHHRTCFASALEARARKEALPDWVDTLHAVDVARFLGVADYLPLDGHLNARGHRKIAERLARMVSSPGRGAPREGAP